MVCLEEGRGRRGEEEEEGDERVRKMVEKRKRGGEK